MPAGAAAGVMVLAAAAVLPATLEAAEVLAPDAATLVALTALVPSTVLLPPEPVAATDPPQLARTRSGPASDALRTAWRSKARRDLTKDE